MMRKRWMALVLAAVLGAGLTACGGTGSGSAPAKAGSGGETVSEETASGEAGDGAASGEDEAGGGDKVSITLWTYPVGDWGNSGSVANLIAGFQKAYPQYQVSVECLTYNEGDARIEEAAEAGVLPDLVMEGPERLVANWGSRGLMVDLADLWESEQASEIYESVRKACRHTNGEYYEFPLCMTAHCMAINYDMFEKAGALQYIDQESRTWTTDGFIKAVEALYDSGQENVAAIYCGGQGGDQGTRALVNNLYSGSFTDEEHTRYVLDSPENLKALELLRNLEGIHFAPDMQGGDELEHFADGDLAMSFCWNVAAEISQTLGHPNLDFDIFPMAFPTDNGVPTLQGGIWGFGIFDNGDEAKIEAAKTFIEYMTGDQKNYTRAVQVSSYWPVREVPGLYANDDLMDEYGVFTQYLGDYYQVTSGWANARTAWWQMLQKIGEGADIVEAVREFERVANQK